jgi:hypothetical protein
MGFRCKEILLNLFLLKNGSVNISKLIIFVKLKSPAFCGAFKLNSYSLINSNYFICCLIYSFYVILLILIQR